MAYFHFDQEISMMSSHLAALQSFAEQLLCSRAADESFIDAASISMSNRQGRQLNASENVLRGLVQLFLRRLKHTFIVLDGLDECRTFTELLQFLEECTAISSCGIVVLMRPHLPFESFWDERVAYLDLQGRENLEDMKLFMQPRIRDLSTAGQIAGYMSNDEIVTSLALQADSIFLWCSLIIAHLRQPALTPGERRDIIVGKTSFQGLENLFDRILDDIERRSPKCHLKRICNVFEWLVVAQTAWNVDRLHLALAVQDNRSSNRNDLIKNFKKSLVLICGPLIEIRDHEGEDTVRFIHLSVSEYLSKPFVEVGKSPFLVQSNAAHCSLAKMSLSYLMNEVPHAPLSGSPTITADPNVIMNQYCLLLYTATYWTFHAAKAFEISEQLEDDEITDIFKRRCFSTLVGILSKVVAFKPLITLWIEACWMFNSQPRADGLSSNIYSVMEFRCRKAKLELKELSATIARLDSSLEQLNTAWHRVLASEPNEIWQQSIAAFTKSEFWVGTNEATVTSLYSPTADQGSIMIASQVSSDGSEVGVIKVWPPM